MQTPYRGRIGLITLALITSWMIAGMGAAVNAASALNAGGAPYRFQSFASPHDPTFRDRQTIS